MAFLGPNDILVLEKDEGTVQRIVNGTMLQQPLLQVPVATESERGMLGIAVAKHKNGPTYVFLYYTESGGRKTADDSTSGIDPSGNRLYRYELVNNQLVNPKLMLNLPGTPGPNHDGGKVVIGPDNNVYVVIGDLISHRTQAQNVLDGSSADATGGIIRITQDGQAVADSPLGGIYPQNLYYAYGMRNSFGMDFDPVTGKLWDTENGPNYGDEINLVEPGFNSG
jgi:glucose/arabinose dehydrogenase